MEREAHFESLLAPMAQAPFVGRMPGSYGFWSQDLRPFLLNDVRPPLPLLLLLVP